MSKGQLLATACKFFAGIVIASPAIANTTSTSPVSISIPAQELDLALIQLGQQTKQPLLFDPALVHNKRARAVNGTLTAVEALEQMLEGTTLSFQQTPNGALVLKQQESATRPQSAAVSNLAPATAAKATSEVADGAFQEIVVTARRREESAQDVPIALTAVGGAQLEATNTQGLMQVQQQIPSLSITAINPNNTNVNIRGLGANSFLSNVGLENGVGIHIDGVYLARPAQSTFDLVDLDRIEVLRGPQGTLFGKNTTAGAINVITRAPTFDIEGGVDASYGNYDYYQLRGSVSGPLTNTVAARLTLSQTERDGFIRNVRTNKDLNDHKDRAARGQLLFKPSEMFSFRLIADYSDQTSACCANVPAELVTTRIDGTPLPNGFLVRTARVSYTPLPFDAFARRTDADAEYRVDQEQYGVSGEINVDFGNHVLTSISAWRKWKYDPRTDADGIGLTIFQAAQQVIDDEQFTQEIRLASAGSRVVDYVVGLYYYDHDVDVAQATQYGPDAPDFALGGANPVTTAALSGFTVLTDSRLRGKSYAAFGQATWNATDALSLTAGLRYNHETKKGHLNQSQAGGANLSALPSAIAGPAQAIRDAFGARTSFIAETKEKGLTGQINVAYDLADDVLGYATYAHGLKSGGINLTNVPNGVSPTVDPEKVNHYEIGIKSRLLDRRVTLNVAAFQTRITDYQTTILDASRSATYLQNAGKVQSRGLEAEAWARPVAGLSLRAGATYVKAKFLSFRNAPCPIEYFGLQTLCDLSGTRLPGAPKWSVSLGADYETAVSSVLDGYAGIDYSYRSSVNTSSNMSRHTLVPEHALVNARIGIRTSDGSWDLSLWARNLFDKNYYSSLTVAGFNSGQVNGAIGDPRTYGLTLRARY